MATFVDSTGGQWVIKVNVAALERVKDMSGVDLGYIKASELKALNEMQRLTDTDEVEADKMLSMLGMFTETTLGRLAVDPVTQASVLFPIVSPQAKERGITREQFVELLDGETLARAFDMFWSEYSAFFLQNRQTIFHQVVEACRQIRMTANADIVTETTGPALPAAPGPVSETSTSGSLSTGLPESSDLIPDPSPPLGFTG